MTSQDAFEYLGPTYRKVPNKKMKNTKNLILSIFYTSQKKIGGRQGIISNVNYHQSFIKGLDQDLFDLFPII